MFFLETPCITTHNAPRRVESAVSVLMKPDGLGIGSQAFYARTADIDINEEPSIRCTGNDS